jgi:hypothetical protein
MKNTFFFGLVLIALVSVAPATGQTPLVPVASSSSGDAKPKTANTDDVRVVFDEKANGILYFETNGKRYKINSVTQTVELADQPTVEIAPKPMIEQVKSPPPETEDLYAYEAGDEPFDYRLVNVPTAKKVPRGTWNISFTHRFSQPIRPFRESGPGLLGFDSMSTSSFGVMYGLTDKLFVNAYRSPLCQRGLCRAIELGLGYHFADQGKHSPVAVSAYASVEGSDNFIRQYTFNVQAMFSRRFGKRVFIHFAPAIHLNSNGQRRFNPNPDDFSPPATIASTFTLPKHTASFGTGVSVRITPTVSGVFEFTPRTGFKLGRVQPIFDNDFNVIGFKNMSQPEMGIGLQYVRGGHSFTLTLSNTQTTTTSRYNSSNLILSPRDLIIGFNLFRRW